MVAPAEIEKTLRSPPLKTHSGSSFALFVFDSSAMAGTALRLANATKGSYRALSGHHAEASRFLAVALECFYRLKVIATRSNRSYPVRNCTQNFYLGLRKRCHRDPRA